MKKIRISDTAAGAVILGLAWLAFIAAIFSLSSSCASTENVKIPTGCDAKPEPLTGYLGQVRYPENLDINDAVYCGCAFSCPDIGPAVIGISIGECIADVPQGCATRAVFCPAPDRGGDLL